MFPPRNRLHLSFSIKWINYFFSLFREFWVLKLTFFLNLRRLILRNTFNCLWQWPNCSSPAVYVAKQLTIQKMFISFPLFWKQKKLCSQFVSNIFIGFATIIHILRILRLDSLTNSYKYSLSLSSESTPPFFLVINSVFMSAMDTGQERFWLKSHLSFTIQAQYFTSHKKVAENSSKSKNILYRHRSSTHFCAACTTQ